MNKILLVCIIITTYNTHIKAQDSSLKMNCFPFGTSLSNASVNSDGTKLRLQNVYNYHKVFDLQTGQVLALAAHKDYWSVIEPIMLPQGYTPVKSQYKVEENEIREGSKKDYQFTVTDSLNNVVTTFIEKDVNWSAFNSKNGNLVLGTGGTIYSYLPGKKRKKIIKANYFRTEKSYYWDTQSFVDGAKFSPSGRYMISKKGYITDLKEGKVLKNVFVVDNRTGPFKYGPRPFDISFNPEETTCTVSIHEEGLCTYNLSTGYLVNTVLIPAQVLYPELIDIFEIVQLPKSNDFIYWLNFKNKTAPMALAFYVKDSIPLPLCDPDWEKESITNYLVLLSQKNEQEAKARAAEKKRRIEEEAYRLAHPNEKPREVYRKPEVRLVQQVCGYCNGSGSIAFEKFIIGGKSETTVTTGLYGRRTYNTTGGTGSATCSACKGKKYIGVWKEYTPKN
jgi:hypothetical protein